MCSEVMGMGEKTPKNIYTRKKTRKNSPFGFPPIPHVYKIWRPIVFRVERCRKQAGPTLGGWES